MRKKTSLFGKQLQKALYLEQVWEKSEQLPSFLPFYEGKDLLDQIQNNTNQLIVGRRGTGKTHLLGAFAENIWRRHFDQIALRISIMELGQTPPLAHTESPEFAAKRMARDKFDQFLRVFFYRLLETISRHCKDRIRSKIPESQWREGNKHVDNILFRMMEAIELGREYNIRKTRQRSQKESKTNTDSASISFGAQLKNSQPEIDGNISFGKRNTASGQESIETTIESIMGVDLYDVRDLLTQLLEVAHINTLYILIDEWMEIDKNTPSSIQANFAQLLKMTFFNHQRIAVKIASVWHETTLYSKGDMAHSRGLQLGQDIQLGPDLDTAFISDEHAILNFGRNILFKRLSHASPDLLHLAPDGEVSDIFIDELFDGDTNFRAFLAASHGIPRDMMKVFFKCSLRIKGNFSNECIDFSLIASVAKDIYKTVKRKSIDPESTAQLLLDQIDSYLESTGRRLFLIPNNQTSRSAHLRELVDDEVIHQIPSSMTPRSIRNKYKAYHIDYGNVVDWIDTKRKEISEILSHSIVPDFPSDFENHLHTYIIDAVSVVKDHIDCINCGHGFLESNPVFKKAGICPRCAEPPR